MLRIERKVSLRIGKYVTEGEIGSGSFGVVYKATDTIQGVVVALKIATVSQKMFNMLTKEARTLTTLDHPNIVKIYNADISGNQFLIAMECMMGGSLQDLMDEKGGPLEIDEAMRIILQVLSGLRYAHNRNIVHRDIKPSNILLDEEGNAKLGDFGIAKILDSKGVASTIVGTPPYMAPEQWEGKTTTRSELYSVGVILYEMLTGSRAFPGKTESEIRKKIQRGEFIRPRQVNPNIPDEIENIILKSMAVSPQNRFSCADELISAIKGKSIEDIVIAPKLDGLMIDDVERQKQRLGINLRIKGYEKSGKVGSGVILWQSIKEGTKMKRGGTIEVIVSKGPSVGAGVGVGVDVGVGVKVGVSVPNVVGYSKDKAVSILHEKGFRIFSEIKDIRDISRNGEVISQNPSPNREAEKGSDVVITVGRYVKKGGLLKWALIMTSVFSVLGFILFGMNNNWWQKDKIEIPDVVGMTNEEADNKLKTANKEAIPYKIEEEETEIKSEIGIVIKQSPLPGKYTIDEFPGGSPVVLTIGKEKEEEKTVPNLVGMKKSDAEKILITKGLLNYNFNEKNINNPDKDNIVLSQEPSSGTYINSNTVISLTIGNYKVSSNYKTCPGCGRQVKKNKQFCPYCGYQFW